MLEFEQELRPILDMLNSSDEETRFLGYSLLRNSDFKKAMRGRVLIEKNKSFYRFNLYALNNKPPRYPKNQFYINYYNDNKLNFAYRVILLYLENKLIIRKL